MRYRSISTIIAIIFSLLAEGCITFTSENLAPVENEKSRITTYRGIIGLEYQDSNFNVDVIPAQINSLSMFLVIIGNKTTSMMKYREANTNLIASNDNSSWVNIPLWSSSAMDSFWRYYLYTPGKMYQVLKRSDILWDSDINAKSIYSGYIQIDPTNQQNIYKHYQLNFIIEGISVSFNFEYK